MPIALSSPPMVVGMRQTSSATSTVTVMGVPCPAASTLKSANALSVEWSFGEQGKPVETVTTYGHEETEVTHVFGQAGTLEVTETIHTDNLSTPVVTAKTKVKVVAAPPKACFSSPTEASDKCPKCGAVNGIYVCQRPKHHPGSHCCTHIGWEHYWDPTEASGDAERRVVKAAREFRGAIRRNVTLGELCRFCEDICKAVDALSQAETPPATEQTAKTTGE